MLLSQRWMPQMIEFCWVESSLVHSLWREREKETRHKQTRAAEEARWLPDGRQMSPKKNQQPHPGKWLGIMHNPTPLTKALEHSARAPLSCSPEWPWDQALETGALGASWDSRDHGTHTACKEDAQQQTRTVHWVTWNKSWWSTKTRL